ncbi:MAG: IS91 family transposase [Flavobacteriales bacterium]|nr:IS91 family transposase [Flavobacteriales bacterium]
MRVPRYELAQVVKMYGDQFLRKYPQKKQIVRALYAISVCRTAALGGHVSSCNKCGHKHPAYNSCRNRHCPKCQNARRERWIQLRAEEIPNVGCYHVVFTLPSQLYPLCVQYGAWLYDILFTAAWQTIAAMSRNPSFLGAEPGMVTVLHTWGQQLNLHPHLHCIIPAGGIDSRGGWKQPKGKNKYLFPINAMCSVFRAKYMAGLTAVSKREGISISQTLRKELMRQPWVVYAKAPIRGKGQIIEYLGRYSHKIAISNHRLTDIENGAIGFRYKDYRSGGQTKELRLDANEFLRRYCRHILPNGFRRIRHYGFLSNRRKRIVTRHNKRRIERIKRMSWVMLCRTFLGFDPIQCPKCKTGRMELSAILIVQRGPPLQTRKVNTENAIV